MINFVVVEDNNKHREKVTKIILSYMMNNKEDFEIYEFSDYTIELINYIKNNKSNSIYILDLELINGDGIDIARRIRNNSNDWTSPIIILTAHTSLYYEVYKQRLQILDFIGKCDNIDKNIRENIDICFKMLNINTTYKFTYKNVDYSIPYSSINYFQRDGRRTKIVTTDGIYYRNLSVSEVLKTLPNNFKLSLKGTIININNIYKIDWQAYKVYFKDGTNDYVVSKSHKKELDIYEFD